MEHLFTATTHDYLMFFTVERPLLCRARLRDTRRAPARARDAQIVNLLELRNEEKIAATIRHPGTEDR